VLPIPDAPRPAVVLTDGLLDRDFAKTCHGILRGSRRFRAVAVIDHVHAGRDAGEVMEGRRSGVPVVKSLEAWLSAGGEVPDWFVVGVAFSGGRLPASCRGEISEALRRGIGVVSGLHQMVGDDPEFRALAARSGARIVDVRRPRPTGELRFWTGDVLRARAVIVAVLGTDCAVGKRTTAKWTVEACRSEGLRAEMLYTGQTGWMQGHPYGFIFDATVNDFIAGEIERAILECDSGARPDVILVEGQGALRNPSGPCGSEFILSGNARGVILQHVPAREFFVDHEDAGRRVPRPEEEIALIRQFGADVLAVTLNGRGWDGERLDAYRRELEARIGLPVVLPLEEGAGALVPVIRAHVDRVRAGRTPGPLSR
jgi:uncharacterized NAD-dependent epimerase/dehydratase family protein